MAKEKVRSMRECMNILTSRLKADEIEFRIMTSNNTGFQLMAYKNSRTDVGRLNEAFGSRWYQKYFRDDNGCLACEIRVYDHEIEQWIGRVDIGAAGNGFDISTKTKGEYSDALKRSGFRWGIGDELYSFPFIWITIPANILASYKGKCKDARDRVNQVANRVLGVKDFYCQFTDGENFESGLTIFDKFDRQVTHIDAEKLYLKELAKKHDSEFSGQPSNDSKGDKKPSGKKPADKKKPSSKKPVDKKPVDKKPVDKKPVDKKPADNNKPIELPNNFSVFTREIYNTLTSKYSLSDTSAEIFVNEILASCDENTKTSKELVVKYLNSFKEQFLPGSRISLNEISKILFSNIVQENGYIDYNQVAIALESMN